MKRPRSLTEKTAASELTARISLSCMGEYYKNAQSRERSAARRRPNGANRP